jgi:LacI family transcriptional regulator
MANEKVTSLDVARRAGVSQSAVSRVFTPGASASKRTIEKVRRAAAELGYRPNVLARSLITGRSRIIGLVVAYLENYFYPEVVERLSVALQEQGYHVLVFMAAPTVGDVEGVLQEILDYQVDGIVLASVSMSSILAEQCQALDIPVVLFNRDQDDPRLSSVTTDNRAGGRALADLLVSLGHQRIAYIAGFEDHMAFAVMDVIRFELGLRIPEDVSVVGFDDVPPAAWPAYNLTTFRQRVNRMVAETVSTLIDRIEAKNAEPRRVKIDGALIVRKSTRDQER